MLINDDATRQVAETIGNTLGIGFTLRNANFANGAAVMEYPDGRALGFRPIFGGAFVQLWIIGNAEPAGEGEPPSLGLPKGCLYHAAISLMDAEDADPADLILQKLTNDLIPAFDFKPHYVGHRPWEAAFENALASAIAEQGSRSRNAGQGQADEAAPTEPPTEAVPGPEEPASASTDEPATANPEPEDPATASTGEPAAASERAAGPDTSEDEGPESATKEVKKAPARTRTSRRRAPAAPGSD
ncbi:hypothetical protein [Streptomyces lavendulae]|uniref:hypothetical protein n=1 Tax=Streptomyces lavendulae TaxID=1914 RepID=UPI0036E3E382